MLNITGSGSGQEPSHLRFSLHSSVHGLNKHLWIYSCVVFLYDVFLHQNFLWDLVLIKELQEVLGILEDSLKGLNSSLKQCMVK